MNFQISSEKIGNPLLIELLKKLVNCFDTIGLPFYIIGATARDIILRHLIDIASQRKTQDLDITIAILDWDKFEEVSKILVTAGLEKYTNVYEREDFDTYLVGGIWLAFDLLPLLNTNQLAYYADMIQQANLLIMQI